MSFPLEDLISNQMLGMVGDPAFIGVIVLGLFMGIVFLSPTHPALKGIGVLGGALLAIPFLGWAAFIWILGIGGITWLAARRLWG